MAENSKIQPPLPAKKVKLQLVGLDGNAFSLMGAFQRQARHEKWTPEEIKIVMDRCISGDYNNLLNTLAEVCDEPDEDEEEVEKGHFSRRERAFTLPELLICVWIIGIIAFLITLIWIGAHFLHKVW